MGPLSKKSCLTHDEILETEGEKHLQTLVKKQLNTSITLQQQLAQHKTFKQAGEYDPEIRSLSGITQLADYKSVANIDGYIEEMKQCGLTKDEIELKLGVCSTQNNDRRTSKSKYGANPQIQEERLQKLELKITESRKQLSKPDTFSGVVHLGRHQMELEKSLININEETKNISNALTREGTHIIGDRNDPINHLPDILKDVQRKAKLESRRNKKRPRGSCTSVSEDVVQIERPSDFIGPLPKVYYNTNNKISTSFDTSDFIGPLPKVYNDTNYEVSTSFHTESSMLNQNIPNPISVTQVAEKNRTVSEQNDSANKSNNASADDIKSDNIDAHAGPRELKTEIEFVPEEVIKKYRLSQEEIRNLPRFKNFSPGDLSNVLYLKNLASLVTEEDLVSLFGRFQKTDKIIYKLMTGRMRGQAFITFSDVPTAELALQLVNGYHFKGKPIIIQYGKKASEDMP